MDVVRHQDIRMDRAARVPARLAQHAKVTLAIGSIDEHCCAVIAALDEVHRLPGAHESWSSRHAG
jgi:hypothetical protein